MIQYLLFWHRLLLCVRFIESDYRLFWHPKSNVLIWNESIMVSQDWRRLSVWANAHQYWRTFDASSTLFTHMLCSVGQQCLDICFKPRVRPYVYLIIHLMYICYQEYVLWTTCHIVHQINLDGFLSFRHCGKFCVT